MGLSCSKEEQAVDVLDAIPDPDMYSFWKRSVDLDLAANSNRSSRAAAGQSHLLFKHQSGSGSGTSTSLKNISKGKDSNALQQQTLYPTRLLIRRHQVRSTEEGVSGTHIYACRWTAADQAEQCPPGNARRQESAPAAAALDVTSAAEPSSPTTTITTTIITEPPPAGVLSKTATKKSKQSSGASSSGAETLPSTFNVDQLFAQATMASPPARKGTV